MPVFLVVFSLTFFLIIDPGDYDFRSRAASGRYSVSAGHLPEKGTFSFTSQREEDRAPSPYGSIFFREQRGCTGSISICTVKR